MRAPAIAAAALLAACAHHPAMDVPASLAAAETAFAAHSMREDMRVAFLEAFAADGVLPRDRWVVVREDFRDRPRPPIVLEWKPVHVEVARHVQVNELEERQNVAAGVTEAVSCST